MKRMVLIIIFLLTVLCLPSISAVFQIEIYPDTGEPIRPGIEKREINGFAKYDQPSKLMKMIPGAYFWQSYSIVISEKPEWAVVTITPSDSIISFDSQEDISIVVSVTENAPAYEYGVISLDIESGYYIRNTPFGNFFPSYPFDKDIAIQAGYLPLLSSISSGVKEGIPNSQITHILTLKNSGNARSRLDFYININDMDQEIGWGAQQPNSLFIDVDETINVPLTIITPNQFGFIDDWAQISVDVTVSSPLEPLSNNTATFTVPTTSHCVGVFVPIVPGGNNPVVVLIIFITIIISIFIVIKFKIKRKK